MYAIQLLSINGKVSKNRVFAKNSVFTDLIKKMIIFSRFSLTLKMAHVIISPLHKEVRNCSLKAK